MNRTGTVACVKHPHPDVKRDAETTGCNAANRLSGYI